MACLLLALASSALTGCVRWSPPAMAPLPGVAACRSDSLSWLSPDDPVERRRLDAWCDGVGPPLFRSRDNAASKAAGIHDVTFVSWNVHVGNGDVRAFVKDLRAGVHTRDRSIQHFVLILQEAVRTAGVPPLRSGAEGAARMTSAAGEQGDIGGIADDLGLSLAYVPSMRNGRSHRDPFSDRGSAILTTFPLSDPAAIELPGERQRRVAIVVKAGEIWVGSIHLDALGAANRLWIFWTPWMRGRQVRSLGTVLPEGPLVLGADLNTWHGIDEQAVRLLDNLPGVTRATISRGGLGLRVLDYLVFRVGGDRRAHSRQLDERYGSDHKPLIGWIE